MCNLLWNVNVVMMNLNLKYTYLMNEMVQVEISNNKNWLMHLEFTNDWKMYNGSMNMLQDHYMITSLMALIR